MIVQESPDDNDVACDGHRAAEQISLQSICGKELRDAAPAIRSAQIALEDIRRPGLTAEVIVRR